MFVHQLDHWCHKVFVGLGCVLIGPTHMSMESFTRAVQSVPDWRLIREGEKVRDKDRERERDRGVFDGVREFVLVPSAWQSQPRMQEETVVK